ncbi:Thivi_2564 family membrane protein [Legionella nagasakiensis]|uniref:Thivi_2564 family membrane protein n=1 Tax=Legionella nagasakiensis TaxID=535290 RepID=UPI001056A6A4|nr:Thivi_2564 family membrane protein [Legionella nagasakiensis]
MNDLLNLFAIIIVFGVVLGLINAFLPMARAIKSLLNILVLIVLVLYILQFFEIIPTIIPMFRVIR